ncbi:hypothetical protein [uncultured Shewanella sp.]|uniref:hypothetical protein n=1 Tax=uncultured Shewanella sp. TaxID=173975 RepID=UPI00260D5B7B|nr:hypothetical protein [uncultured Shewanella sp.]
MLTFPEGIYPTSCDWRLVHRTKVFTNPYSNQTQTLSLPGAYWHAKLQFANLTRAQGQTLHAFVSNMQGMAGRVKLFDHAFSAPRGHGRGTPFVKGSNQTGNQLAIDGVESGTFLQAGDYCQIGEQLVILTSDATASSDGECVLNFQAALRRAPADGSPIIVQSPCAVMQLKDDNQGLRRSTKSRVISSFSLEFIEDVST